MGLFMGTSYYFSSNYDTVCLHIGLTLLLTYIKHDVHVCHSIHLLKYSFQDVLTFVFVNDLGIRGVVNILTRRSSISLPNRDAQSNLMNLFCDYR